MFKLSNATLLQKFSILGIMLLLVAALPATLYVMNITSELDVVKKKAAGTAPVIALQRVIQYTQQHRGTAAGMLGGNETLTALLPAIQDKLRKASEIVDTSLKSTGSSSKILSQWESHKQRLSEIKQAVNSRQLKISESTEQHSRFIAKLLETSEAIQEESGLSLDNVASSYFLINASMVNAPKLAENMGIMRAIGAGFLVSGQLPAEGRDKLLVLRRNVEAHYSDLHSNVDKATKTNAALKAELGTKISTLQDQISRVLTMTDRDLLKAQTLSYSADKFFSAYTHAIDVAYAFNKIAIDNLVSMMNARAADMQQSLYWLFALMLLAILVTVGLSIVFVRSITTPINEAIKIANAVAAGDLTNIINDKSTNETGKLFRALKKMSESLATHQEQVADLKSETRSVSMARAMVYFKIDGTIISANDNFLKLLGYTLDEIKGKHHDMFIDPARRQDSEYQSFWNKLSHGEFFVGQYKRIGKNGEEVWIQSNYNPVMDVQGKPYKVVLYGSDITAMKLHNVDAAGQIEAVNKVQAVIEFELDGTIINANDNFLSTLGYRLDEIKGKHHSMFVDAEYRKRPEYKEFWDKLNTGTYDSGQYKRIGAGGKEVWIQASYFPIMDLNGKPFKVVKHATDITEHIKATQMLDQAVEQTLKVVSVAKDGDLTQRIPLEGKTGAIGTLCTGVNELMENCTSSLKEVVHVLEALSKGDLTQKISNDYQGVFGQMKDDTNETVDKLIEIVGDIRGGTEAIDTASKEIAAGNNDLSQRTEEQASSLEETASSMEELTSTVKQNADNAKQANQLAIGASDIAVKGGTVVGQVVTTMSSINDSSKKIVDIISVIDGIAFQTNILALNAAVEAARAGEQGRGFAVVATEVRTLAQRSAAAAKEIKALIDDSVGKVEEGTELVDQAGKTMDEIVQSVKRVTDIMAEISAASNEQSSGIEQVNQAVTQMDEVTQQNAALVEQAAAASESMMEQSDQLMQTVSIFRLGQNSLASSTATAQERRGPNRAKNIERISKTTTQNPSATKEMPAPKPRKEGTDDEWAEF